jgi:membrane-associated protein
MLPLDRSSLPESRPRGNVEGKGIASWSNPAAHKFELSPHGEKSYACHSEEFPSPARRCPGDGVLQGAWRASRTMSFIVDLIDKLRHLEQYLFDWADALGPWFYVALFLVVFAETGLVVTPFLPGDSLLFAIGALVSRPGSTLSLTGFLVLLIVAAVLGDAVNYAIGLRLGPAVFRSQTSWLLNKKHLFRAQQFYKKYGSKTIILARFVPIVRTFAPFVAGIGKMTYSKFFTYNVVGGIAWVALCLFSGFFFGQIEFVKKNFEIVVLVIIAISVLPIALDVMLARIKKPTPVQPDPAANPAPEGHTAA